MLKQHVRRQKRAEGGLLVYGIVAIYFIIILAKTTFQPWIKIGSISIFLALAIVIYMVEAKKGTFNKIKISEEGIEIIKLGDSKHILWKEISNVRILHRYMDLKNGLEERYYGVYYTRDEMEYKELISYNIYTDRELKKYYKRKE